MVSGLFLVFREGLLLSKGVRQAGPFGQPVPANKQ